MKLRYLKIISAAALFAICVVFPLRALAYTPDPYSSLKTNIDLAIKQENKVTNNDTWASLFSDKVGRRTDTYKTFTDNEIGVIAGTYAYSITGYGQNGFDFSKGLAQFAKNNPTAQQNIIKLGEQLTQTMADSLRKYNEEVPIRNLGSGATNEQKSQLSEGDAYIQQQSSNAESAQIAFNNQTGWPNDPKLVARARAQQEEALKQQNQIIYCVRGGLMTGIEFSAMGCIASLSYGLLWIVSWVLWAAGLLFDTSINYTLNLKQFIESIQIVNIGWTIMRDFCNSLFIFILLYMGIATILRIESYGTKQLIGKLILAALLINFSLFFTKIIVDVSNVTALQFYNAMASDEAGLSQQQQGIIVDNKTGISGKVLKALGMQTVWGVKNSINDGSGNLNPQQSDPLKIPLNPTSMAIIGLGGSILIIILSLILFAATAMFIARTVILVFLMILSPFAFISRILPSTQQYSKQWWDKLIKQAIFAPAYMVLMYLVMQMLMVVGKSGFGGMNRGNGSGFAGFFTGTSNNIGIIFMFIVICSMFLAALLIADKMGASGSKMAMDWKKSVQGWGTGTLKWGGSRLGSSTLGRASDVLKNSELVKNVAGSRVGSWVGARAALRGLDNVSKYKFGGTSYADRQSASEKKMERDYGLIKGDLVQGSKESSDDYDKRKAAAENRAREAIGLQTEGGIQSGRQARGLGRSKRKASLVVQAKFSEKKKGKNDERIKEIGSLLESTKYNETSYAAAVTGLNTANGNIKSQRDIIKQRETDSSVREAALARLAVFESEAKEFKEIINGREKLLSELANLSGLKDNKPSEPKA